MSQVPEREPIERREVVRVSQHPAEHGGPLPPGADAEHRERIVHDVAAERWQWLDKLTQLVWLLLGIVEGMIGLRVLLKLIAANPENPFARFVYDFTALLLWPFFGLTASPAIGDVVLEVPALIAMLVYALAAWALVRLIWLLFDRVGARSVSTYDRYRS